MNGDFRIIMIIEVIIYVGRRFLLEIEKVRYIIKQERNEKNKSCTYL